jgi:putative colanic acid biosynthesis acetyltransferase WcaF
MKIDATHPAVKLETQEPGTRELQAYVDLAAYRSCYNPGRGLVVRAVWYIVSLVIFESGWVPLSCFKAFLLRLFGAQIGTGLVIKPHVRIKYPWRFFVGDHCWIGEDVWIDNLADVHLASQVCISQGAYLCTGSHDHTRRTFDLITRPILVEAGAWIGAKAIVLPGNTIGSNGVVAAGAVIRHDVQPATIVGGQPTRVLAERST